MVNEFTHNFGDNKGKVIVMDKQMKQEPGPDEQPQLCKMFNDWLSLVTAMVGSQNTAAFGGSSDVTPPQQLSQDMENDALVNQEIAPPNASNSSTRFTSAAGTSAMLAVCELNGAGSSTASMAITTDQSSLAHHNQEALSQLSAQFEVQRRQLQQTQQQETEHLREQHYQQRLQLQKQQQLSLQHKKQLQATQCATGVCATVEKAFASSSNAIPESTIGQKQQKVYASLMQQQLQLQQQYQFQASQSATKLKAASESPISSSSNAAHRAATLTITQQVLSRHLLMKFERQQHQLERIQHQEGDQLRQQQVQAQQFLGYAFSQEARQPSILRQQITQLHHQIKRQIQPLRQQQEIVRSSLQQLHTAKLEHLKRKQQQYLTQKLLEGALDRLVEHELEDLMNEL
ncbi:hypothetical protein Poli38472_001854 [Pythium oligandrum]|uniref:Uncharacterized protein n=1 Tax=Pythium oligandrum TaxID=41045 RepID=A0A8K1CWU0_PYTOL|nr:hypothetical protein Poli38472_001854 [Pythium oligandrum]|eukprot:TMW69698.1 hypothetical protein Poli38472_001854 [Pythium oligandrum]